MIFESAILFILSMFILSMFILLMFILLMLGREMGVDDVHKCHGAYRGS